MSILALDAPSKILTGYGIVTDYSKFWSVGEPRPNYVHTTTSLILDTVVDLREAGVEIRNDDVYSFISRHPDINQYLLQIPGVVRKYFSESKLCLRVAIDPDSNQYEPDLFLDIQTRLPVDEARMRLKQMRHDWLYKISSHDIAHFGIHIKYS